MSDLDRLRPRTWSDYIGQERLKAELDVRVSAAIAAQRPLKSILLVGPPGAGKTSLASVIAHKMGEPLEELTMPVTTKTIMQYVKQYEGVLVLDEAHLLSKTQQHGIMTLVKDHWMADTSGHRQHTGALSIIATSHKPEDIIEPLWDRFEVPFFDDYSDEEMTLIALSMAEKIGIDIAYDVAEMFGRASCGVPRRTEHFIEAYEELVLAHGGTPTGDEVLSMMRTTHDGLSKAHVDYLLALQALGNTAGLKRIASVMRLHPDVVVGLEHLLFQKQMISYSGQGRELDRAGHTRLRGDIIPDASLKAAA